MNNKTNQILIPIFFIFILTTAVSATYYFWPPVSERDSSSANWRAQNDPGSTNSLRSFDYGAGNKDSSPPQNNNLDSRSASSTDRFRGNDNEDPSLALRMTATIIADEKTYPLSVPPNTSVYEAMRQLTIDSRQPFLFTAKEYPGMGYFVEEINNIKNDPANNTYWIMYINGESAQMGAAQYILKPNDTINWKYEVAKF